MPNNDNDNKPPPEGIILFAMIGIILGGTLIINGIINLHGIQEM